MELQKDINLQSLPRVVVLSLSPISVNAYFYFYTVDLQRDMHYADFVVEASTIVHGLKTGNSLKQSVRVGVWITSDGRLFQSAIVLGMKLFW